VKVDVYKKPVIEFANSSGFTGDYGFDDSLAGARLQRVPLLMSRPKIGLHKRKLKNGKVFEDVFFKMAKPVQRRVQTALAGARLQRVPHQFSITLAGSFISKYSKECKSLSGKSLMSLVKMKKGASLPFAHGQCCDQT
jgi:hypothetical protein